MKTKMHIALLGALVLMAGCVKTLDDGHAFALSTRQDHYESRYERTPQQVYDAAVEVFKFMGAISRENVLNPGAAEARVIEGKINGNSVWVRVQAVDPKITSVNVQVREGAGTDQDLTQEIQKQIAIKLASR